MQAVEDPERRPDRSLTLTLDCSKMEVLWMTIQLNVPEDVAVALSVGQDLSRTVVESLAIEGYRSGRLAEEQVRRMLDFESRFQVHEFLKQHNAYLNYTEEDLAQDLEMARQFNSK